MVSRLFIFVIILISIGVKADNVLTIGDIPPNYLGNDSDGNEVNLIDNKGKIVVISFWATWCPSCLKELPILENIQNKVGLDKIKVVAINFKENLKQYRQIKRRLSSFKLTLTHDRRGNIADKYGVEAIPNLFIVSKEGKLIFHHVGYGKSSVDKIVKVLNEQLAG